MNHRRPLAMFAFMLACLPLSALGTACGGGDDDLVAIKPSGLPIEQKTGVNWFVDQDKKAGTPRTAIPTRSPRPIVTGDARYEVAAKKFLADNFETFGVKVDEIVHRETLRGQDGIWRVKFVQQVGAMQLQNAAITVSIDAAGSLETFHGPFYPTFKTVAAQKAAITPDAATATATAAAQTAHPGVSGQSPTLLVIVDPVKQLPALVYRVTLSAGAGLVHVDAMTGKVVGARALRQSFFSATGKGIKDNDLTFTIGAAANGTYTMSRPAEGDALPMQVQAFAGGTEDVPQGAAITSATGTAWEADRAATEKGSAVEVYSRLAGAAGFYANLGWKGFDNKGSPIRAYVYQPATDGINAHFSGDKANPFLIWTSGTADEQPAVGTDVIAHEYMHGIVAFTSDLVYENESGAINEGLADIFGNAAEQATTGGDKDLLGEYTNALRSMANPTSKDQPDTYDTRQQLQAGETPSDDNDFGGVHTNSGIVNLAYYLMAYGGTHPSTSVEVPALADGQALKVWWETARERLKPNSTMRELAAETLKTTSSMGFETKSVGCAWVAVGVLTRAEVQTDFQVTCLGGDDTSSSSSSSGEEEESSSSSSSGEAASSSSSGAESTSGAAGGSSGAAAGGSSGEEASSSGGAAAGGSSSGGVCATADGCGNKKAGWYCSEIQDKAAFQCKGETGSVGRAGAAVCPDGGNGDDEGTKKACGCTKAKSSCDSSSTCNRDSKCDSGACTGGTCGTPADAASDADKKQVNDSTDTVPNPSGGGTQTASDPSKLQ